MYGVNLIRRVMLTAVDWPISKKNIVSCTFVSTS
jgi:hypothetical protein